MNRNLGRQFDAKGFNDIADSHEVDVNRGHAIGALKKGGFYEALSHGGWEEYGHKWEEQPVQSLDPAKLKLTQTSIHREGYEKHVNTEELPPASVVRIGGEHFLRDGHHRWAVAHDRGELLRAHVYDARGKR